MCIDWCRLTGWFKWFKAGKKACGNSCVDILVSAHYFDSLSTKATSTHCVTVLHSLRSSMNEASPDPITRPNSPLDGWPALAQLHFVNAGLEKNPHPREHYDRQFSVTPERQTPESQRTPLVTWSEPDPIEELEEAKDWAAKEAKRLEKFYPGRLLLRKEEPERYGIFAEDPDYWYSQKAHWKTEYEKLAAEYDRRKQLEAEGKANEGFAQDLLLSPIHSPSPPPLNSISQATAAGIKKHESTAVRPFRQPVTATPSSRVHVKRSRYLSQLNPEDSPRKPARASKRLKHKGKQEEQNAEEETIAQTTNPTPKARPNRVTKSAPRPRKSTTKVSKTKNNKARRQGRLQSTGLPAPRVLPWTLRSMNAISYRETGTRAASKKKRRSGRGRAFK